MDNQEQNNTNIQNNSTQPNFQQIFNVESEENKPVEQPVPEEQPVQQNIPKVRSTFNGTDEVLYTQKEEKEKSSLVPILLFGCLIAMIFLLPSISKKVEFNIFDPGEVEKPGASESEEDKFYEFNKSSVRAKIGTLELTNFAKFYDEEKNQYTLSFTINNVGEKSYDFKKKYYIVMYNGNKIVHRALLHSYDGLGALSATTLTLITNKRASEAEKFKLEEIPTASYPEVNLGIKEGEYNILTCTFNYNTIKYYFSNDELMKINDEHLETSLNNRFYTENRNKYRADSTRYKKVNNIDSIFIENDEYFRMINNISLKDIQDSTMTHLRTYKFFKYKENVKTISFEMEALGYNCE